MPKPRGGLLLRKTRLKNKWLAWLYSMLREYGVQVRSGGRLDLRNQRHRKSWEENK